MYSIVVIITVNEYKKLYMFYVLSSVLVHCVATPTLIIVMNLMILKLTEKRFNSYIFVSSYTHLWENSHNKNYTDTCQCAH